MEQAAHAAVTAHAQALAAERLHGDGAEAERPTYAGLVTRVIAFAVDAAIVNGTGLLVGVVVGLGLSVVNTPKEVNHILFAVGGAVFVAWTVGYFAVFWSTTGQTPGMRVMGIRVRRVSSDAPPRLGAALVRLIGLFLAALPLLLGFLPILLNERRRGLQDFLGRTVVVHGAPISDEPQVRSSSTS